jgi:hypothetical protein
MKLLESCMVGYKIYILDRTGRIGLAYDFKGADDSSVLEESKRHCDKSAIEIWQQARLVARIDQDGKAANG